MQLYPAIDLKGGACVRLTQGMFDNVKKYSDTPQEMAKLWAEQGARRNSQCRDSEECAEYGD